MVILIAVTNKGKRNHRSNSSNSSKVSSEYFKQAIEVIKLGNYAPVTKVTYHCVWVSFNKFIISLDHIPPTWEEKLALFLACLIEERRPPSTIRCYKSAVKSVLRDNGVPLDDHQLQLAAVLKACKYVDCDVTVRLPIQWSLLRLIIDTITDYFQERCQVYLAVL